MATVPGTAAELLDPIGTAGNFPGRVGTAVSLPQGSGVFNVKYKMRAWETGVGWVTWVSYGTPDPNPPIGTGPVVNVTESAFWE